MIELSCEVTEIQGLSLPGIDSSKQPFPDKLNVRVMVRISNENDKATTVYGWGVSIFDQSPVNPYLPTFNEFHPDKELSEPVTLGHFLEGWVEFIFENTDFRNVIRKKLKVNISDRAESNWSSAPIVIQEGMLQLAPPKLKPGSIGI